MATEHVKIADVLPYVESVANGSQYAFDFPFVIYQASELVVRLDGVEQNSGYTVVPDGVFPGTGSVVFDTLPASGTVVTRERVLPVERVTDFQVSGDLRANTMNDQLDYLTMVDQQAALGQGRSLRVAGDETPVPPLPAAAGRAGRWLAFDNAGAPTMRAYAPPDDLRGIALLEDFALGGANIGNGVTEVDASIQNAMNSGEKVLRCLPGSNYRFRTAGVVVPSGIRLIGDGATFIRDYEGGPALFENATARSTWSDADIELINLHIRNFQRGTGIRLIGVDNQVVAGLKYFLDIPYDPLNPLGAAALEVSGTNVQVFGSQINSLAGGRWSDGIHVTQVNGCQIDRNIILAGDDALGLAFRPASWTTRGRPAPSTGVQVTNNVVQSTMAQAIRIGAESVASTGEDTDHSQTWQDVTVDNLHVYGTRGSGTGGRFVFLDDRRASLPVKNGEIRIGNVRSIDTGFAGQVGIAGNPDVANASYAGIRNFARVTLFGSRYATDDVGTTFWGGGVERLELTDVNLESSVASTGNKAEFYEIEEMVVRDSTMSFDTTANGAVFTRVKEFTSFDSVYDGNNSAHSAILWNTAPGGQKFRMYGGEVKHATSLVRVLGSDTFAERIVSGTKLSATDGSMFSPITATVDIFSPMGELIPGDPTVPASFTFVTSTLNNIGKKKGKQSYCNILGKPLWATGPLPSDPWADSTGAIVYTPISVSNAPPVAVDDAFGATENVQTTFNILANDYDPNTGNTIAAVAGVVITDQGGTADIAANGDVIYDPPPGYTGPDTFQYTVTDGSLTDTGTVTVTISVAGGYPTNYTPPPWTYVYTQRNYSTAWQTVQNGGPGTEGQFRGLVVDDNGLVWAVGADLNYGGTITPVEQIGSSSAGAGNHPRKINSLTVGFDVTDGSDVHAIRIGNLGNYDRYYGVAYDPVAKVTYAAGRSGEDAYTTVGAYQETFGPTSNNNGYYGTQHPRITAMDAVTGAIIASSYFGDPGSGDFVRHLAWNEWDGYLYAGIGRYAANGAVGTVNNKVYRIEPDLSGIHAEMDPGNARNAHDGQPSMSFRGDTMFYCVSTTTPCANYGTTPGAFDENFGSGSHIRYWIAKFKLVEAGFQLQAATYLKDGGTSGVIAETHTIAVLPDGRLAVIAEVAAGSTMPVTPDAIQSTPHPAPNQTVWFGVFNNDLSTLEFATYLDGGTVGERTTPDSIKADASGRVIIGVTTDSVSFPVTDGSTNVGGATRAVPVIFRPAASGPSWELEEASYQYLGQARSVAWGDAGEAYFGGIVTDAGSGSPGPVIQKLTAGGNTYNGNLILGGALLPEGATTHNGQPVIGVENVNIWPPAGQVNGRDILGVDVLSGGDPRKPFVTGLNVQHQLSTGWGLGYNICDLVRGATRVAGQGGAVLDANGWPVSIGSSPEKMVIDLPRWAVGDEDPYTGQHYIITDGAFDIEVKQLTESGGTFSTAFNSGTITLDGSITTTEHGVLIPRATGNNYVSLQITNMVPGKEPTILSFVHQRYLTEYYGGAYLNGDMVANYLTPLLSAEDTPRTIYRGMKFFKANVDARAFPANAHDPANLSYHENFTDRGHVINKRVDLNFAVNPTVTVGELLTQDVSGATGIAGFDATKNQVFVTQATGTFNTSNELSGNVSGSLGAGSVPTSVKAYLPTEHATPYEVLIDDAAYWGYDPWITIMPDISDVRFDALCAKIAATPSLERIYIEVGNEKWLMNGINHADYVRDMGVAKWGANTKYGTSANIGREFAARLDMRLYDRARTNLGAAISRVRWVSCDQIGNTSGTAAYLSGDLWATTKDADGEDALYQEWINPATNPIRCWSWASYWGQGNDTFDDQDPISYENALRASQKIRFNTMGASIAFVTAYMGAAKAATLEFISYEGGYSIYGRPHTIEDTQAMYDLYLEACRGFRDVGLEGTVFYADVGPPGGTQNGDWNHGLNMLDGLTTKFRGRALIDYAQEMRDEQVPATGSHNGQPVQGMVLITDGRTTYNSLPVEPINFLSGIAGSGGNPQLMRDFVHLVTETSTLIPLPTHDEGDYLLSYVGIDRGENSAVTFGVAEGWNLLGTVQSGSGQYHTEGWLYGKIAGATENAPTLSLDVGVDVHGQVITAVLKNVDTVDGGSVSATGNVSHQSVSGTANGVTAAKDNSLVIMFATDRRTNQSFTTTPAFAGEVNGGGGSLGNSSTCYMGTYRPGAAGPTGPISIAFGKATYRTTAIVASFSKA